MTRPQFHDPAQAPTAEQLLAQWIGLDPDTIGTPAIARAVRTRMEALGLESPTAALERAEVDPTERDRLIEEVVVGESWFFRDPQVFAFVCRFASTRAALPDRGPIRILCAPCAGGEEPYSMAMGLLDAGLLPDQFSIDAVDISAVAIERARAGRYSANAFRNADLSFRDRWFRRDGTAAVLDASVRSLVRFARANILDEAFVAEALASGRGPYDVVFCRNLLIYLTAEARSRVTASLDRLVAADGLLVLGAAEPPIIKGDWIPAGDHSVFALRRGVHAHRGIGAPRPPARTQPPRPGRPQASRPPAAPPHPEPVVAVGASLEGVLREAGALANTRRFTAAIALCEQHAREAGPAPALFFLMGILHQSAGDPDRAEACFHKALYLDAAHDEALLALALLAAQRGDAVMAEKYRQSAARILARQATS